MARLWFAVSIAASLAIVTVSLVSPETRFWPFVIINWLVFVPGMLLVLRLTDIPNRNLYFALLAFAAAGMFAVYHSKAIF